MNIAVEYTEEEKKLFDEALRLKEQVRILEDEAFLLAREHKEHTLENHTHGVPPMVYMVGAMFFLTVFICDLIIGFEFGMIHFAAAIALASTAPALSIFFLVMFFISYRRYYYQVVQTEAGKRRAKELHIVNYYAEEDRIMEQYRKTKEQLDRLKALYQEKQDECDCLTARKDREADLITQEAIKKHTRERIDRRDEKMTFWEDDVRVKEVAPKEETKEFL